MHPLLNQMPTIHSHLLPDLKVHSHPNDHFYKVQSELLLASWRTVFFLLGKTMQIYLAFRSAKRCRCVPGALFRLPRDNRPRQKFISSTGQWLITRGAIQKNIFITTAFLSPSPMGVRNALCFFLRCCICISLTQAMMRRKSRAIVYALDAVLLGKQNAAPWP